MKRKVCVVITARASYSRIRSALKAIQKEPSLELEIILSGSAVVNRYGNIEQTVIKDGFTIVEKIHITLEEQNPTTMVKTTGLGLIEFASAFYNLKPDMVVVIADRFETIAVSIAASYQNIPVIHIQGGEISGSIDEKVRHANTKLADLHLVSCKAAKDRVIKMGEDPEFVYDTGCPSIDIAHAILKKPALNFDPYEKYGGVGFLPEYKDGYLIVMQHPVTTEYATARKQIEETLHAIKEMNFPVFWFWPNMDAGSDQVSNGIRAFREKYTLKHIHFFKNMEPDDFLRLLYNSKCLVGNSSVGIRECSFMGVPVVNIGSRQEGRDRAQNVVDVPVDRKAIAKAIQYWLNRERPASSTLYGEGNSGKKIAEVLATSPLRFQKKNIF